jgi:hypothetical protein
MKIPFNMMRSKTLKFRKVMHKTYGDLAWNGRGGGEEGKP